MRASTGSLPLPSPLSLVMDSAPEQNGSTIPDDPLAGVPELKTYVTESHEDKVDALKLVADSVAQMRQAANSAIIYHPLNLTILVAVVASVARTIFERTNRDVGTAATTCTGLVMILLVFCRYLTAPYIVAAEKINLEWLGTADVIVTKFGDEIIGTVVIEWMAGEPKQKRKKPQRGEIKAWAVRMRYRQKGVGSALLEEAVKESRRKGAETIEFADDHASWFHPIVRLACLHLANRELQTRHAYSRTSTTESSKRQRSERANCCRTFSNRALLETKGGEVVVHRHPSHFYLHANFSSW